MLRRSTRRCMTPPISTVSSSSSASLPRWAISSAESCDRSEIRSRRWYSRFSTLLNVGLDILFLVPFRMGPAGAAIATVLAQLLSMLGCFAYTLLRHPELRLGREDWRVGGASLLSHLRQGLPLGLQFSIPAVGIIVMQGAVVRFDIAENGIMVPGTPAQNGFSAANKLINFLMALYNGLASRHFGLQRTELRKKAITAASGKERGNR